MMFATNWRFEKIGMCEPLHSWNHRTFGSKAWLLSVEVLVIIGDQFSTLKICSPKICLTWPTTLGVCHIYGSYKPAGQVGMQPPTAHHMGEGMPTYTHLMQLPGSITMRVRWHSFSHQPQLLAWTSPLCWLNVCPLYDSFNFHEAGKSAECRQGVECRRRWAWWQVWSRG